MAQAREQLLEAKGSQGGSDDDADDFRKQIFRLFAQLSRRRWGGSGWGFCGVWGKPGIRTTLAQNNF